MSKARAAPERAALCQGIDEDSEEANDDLASELRGLKLSQVRKRAEALGITAADIDSAWDSDDPQPALVELVQGWVDGSIPTGAQKGP